MSRTHVSKTFQYAVPIAMRKIWFPAMAVLLAGFLVSEGLSVAQTSSAPTQAPSTLHGDPAHPAQTSNWVETRLYFGLGPFGASEKGVSEQQWRQFLDEVVTPRFPAGLSVVDVYGQWQSQSAHNLERIRSKMLIIDYPANAENRARVEAVRSAWKQRTGDQSVLRVTQPADVSF